MSDNCECMIRNGDLIRTNLKILISNENLLLENKKLKEEIEELKIEIEEKNDQLKGSKIVTYDDLEIYSDTFKALIDEYLEEKFENMSSEMIDISNSVLSDIKKGV